MDRAPLTARQHEAYEFIRSYLEEHRRPPTLKETGEALGIASTNGVYKLLAALEEKGWIQRTKHQARSIQLTDPDPSPSDGEKPPSVPIASRTPSDHPEALWERPQGSLTVDGRLLHRATDPDACLIVYAQDDGMTAAGIQTGDLLLVEEMAWPDIEDGQTVACLVGDQSLAREFHFADRTIHLRPAARDKEEMTVSPETDRCYVIGPVRALLRTR